jgi:hypothetical protein
VNERERRLGENEVLYREVNERVRELHVGFGFDAQLIEFVCECARVECTERIRLSQAEYEHVRESGRRFALVNGHQVPDVEDVVERTDRFVVVEKRPGGPADLAEAEDPR